MKKWMKTGLIAAAAVMAVSGCSSSGEETTPETEETTAETVSEAELTDEASITLGNYKGLELTASRTAVTDEDIDAQLETLRLQYPAVVEGRAAKEGDVANIDYEGTKDGVAFDGGTASGYDLTLGSGAFIEGFEDGVIGMMPGEEKDLNLTFPEDYLSEDLAGQDVVFHVTLNELKSSEGTEVDDALAQRVLGDESATLEDLRTQVSQSLESQAESSFFNAAGNELLTQVINNSEITTDPDAVEQMYQQLLTTYTAYASQYGMELSDFLSLFLGTDEEGLRTNADTLVQQEMVLDEIIAAEDLTATDEQKELLAQMNYFTSADEMVSTYGEESANQLFDMGAAYYYLIDNAVEASPETEAAETEAPSETAEDGILAEEESAAEASAEEE
ncbi:MAG TPA: trigger factor [Candidatus Copromonas faecavium]|uniref:peptidylprolyl isomerase n=1 Tax=Candidatus Copromonas faecavium (nom. illeg.) TaxID=2840740 RepID=A0A9D1A5G8_9FIRM|nr:trigger factor [Candidatus Copromonas faecavium]